MPASGLFVKLDAEYPTDDEFMEAGPLAELLFVRGLCFCKRKRLDGVITRLQLTVVAGNIPQATKHAKALVDVGLWAATPDGWTIPSWFKHNKSADQIAEEKEARRIASVEANHAQHHVGPGKKRSPKCELCRAEPRPPTAPKSEADRTRNRLQEVEEEPESESQVEPEAEVEPSEPSSSVSRRAHQPHPTDDDDDEPDLATAALHVFAQDAASRKQNPAAYASTVIANGHEHLPRLRELAAQHPDADPERIADAYRTGSSITAATSTHPAHCRCDGTGWVQHDPDDGSRTAAVAPCPETEWPTGDVLPFRRAQ